MNGLEQDEAPAVLHEARDVRDGAFERREIAACDGEASEDDGVVERFDADVIEPFHDVAADERDRAPCSVRERVRLEPRGVDGGG